MYHYNILFIMLFFLYGICIGSFVNVCILRIPQDIPITAGRSGCPHCRHTLTARDLVPLVSWILLRGRCRYCHAPVSRQYPLVEGITGLMFVLCYLAYGLTSKAVLLCLFGSVLIAAAGIDFCHTYVPDRFILALLLTAAVLHLLGQGPPLAASITGSLCTAGLLLLISIATKGGIGGADIKLFAVTGLFLGPRLNILALFSGYILAGLWCLPLLWQHKLSRKSEIPMVPYFAVSLMASALWGQDFLQWYLSALI